MARELPFVTAICPTFRHPDLLANSLALWLAQDYPRERRELVILDDDNAAIGSPPEVGGPTFHTQEGAGWTLVASALGRYPSLPRKYNALLAMMPPQTDIVLVWEDDDLYLPSYCRWHVDALADVEFSKPSRVLSDYTGRIAGELAAGRFHASMAFTAGLIRRIGGWPDTKRADFDQQLIARLRQHANGIADPAAGDMPIQYVYSWHTGAAHCQSTMRSGSDETWYERGEQAYAKVPYVGRLFPRLDSRTQRILGQLGVTLEPAA